MTTAPRWFTDTKDGHSQWYVERFRALAASGTDLAGEARLIDAMAPPGSRILDAGCGPGRVAAALHARGHPVVGVDVDPVLIAAAEADHPGPVWVTADLAGFDLGYADPDYQGFEMAVLAGNVMTFLAPGSESTVLARVAAHLRPGGRIVVGFATDRSYSLAAFDRDLTDVGLRIEHRFATWDLEPFTPDAGFAVTVLRIPAPTDPVTPVAAPDGGGVRR